MSWNQPPQPQPQQQPQYPTLEYNQHQPPPQPPREEVIGGGATTLIIKHLPEAIPLDTLSRLFSHYGSLSVRPCSSPRLRNCAFVDFKDEIAASQAQRQLHGLRFLGKVLCVEKSIKPSQDNSKSVGVELENNAMKPPLDKDNMQQGSLSRAEPIADKLGINYPFPPHLEKEECEAKHL